MSKDIDAHRDELRDYVVAQRNALAKQQLRAAARTMTQLLASTPEFHYSVHVACYWPIKGEMDVTPVIEHARRYNKHVYLPVIINDDQIMFAPYEPDMPMKENKFRIPEPDVPEDQLRKPEEMDLVLVPLVVFDSYCHRLGMGGGFYDRTFSFLRDNPHLGKPVLIGAAHEFQHTSELPTHPWDVPTRLVVTEERVWRPQAKIQHEVA